MILNIRATSLLVLALGLGFTAVSCSDDDKQAQETVQPSDSETPATPPSDTMGDAAASEAVSAPVYFRYDDYTLDGTAQDRLKKLADYMKGHASSVVQIEGHTDERGSIEYNLALGERRAQSVKNYLSQLGVDGSRLPTISYGEEKPATEGHDEAAWSKNRRSEFVLSNP